jgi:hypothetical protein
LQKEPLRGHQSGKYRGLLHAIRLIATEEGVGAFWKVFAPIRLKYSTFNFIGTCASARPFRHIRTRSGIPVIHFARINIFLYF